MRWDPFAQHQQMVATHGYRSARFARTFDTFDHVDCFNFMDLHDHLKIAKHGYSKVTDHASREIRHGRLTREQSVMLVNRRMYQPLEYVGLFCAWLGIDESALRFIVDCHRNPTFWQEVEPGRWLPHAGAEHLMAQPSEVEGDPVWLATSSLLLNERQRYITVGKGYP